MKRFLSIVEHELDAEATEALERDEELSNDDKLSTPRKNRKLPSLPSTAIVALEVKTTHEVADRGSNAQCCVVIEIRVIEIRI